jgi:peptidoglycan-associated lipoprotein
MRKILLVLIPLLCIGLTFYDCSKKTAMVQPEKPEAVKPAPAQPSKPAIQPSEPAVKPPAQSVKQEEPAPARAVMPDKTDREQNLSVKTTLEDKVLQMETIHFDYDSYELRPDAIKILGESARLLKKYPTAEVTIEGHCDERGTVEYNIALGERRAWAVKSYLVEYGINPESLITISYGKEKPIDPGHDEGAWEKNRRAAIVPNPE